MVAVPSSDWLRETAPGMSTGNQGAISEMLACVDLIRRGYAVFRAVSPACKCDLIAMRHGRRWRGS